MNKLKNLIFFIVYIFLLFFSNNVFSQDQTTAEQQEILQSQSVNNPYVVALYEPTYLIPLVYTSSWNSADQMDTPNSEKLNNIETKFQISLKAQIWKNFFNYKNSLNLAYTQTSFWQVYNNPTFFRESNYQPEIFFSNSIDKHLMSHIVFNFFNIGALHESNGRGGTYERSWDRMYVETIFSTENWLLSIRPWTVIDDKGLENNRNIANYLGYERVVMSYRFHHQTISLQVSNLEHLGTRASTELTWSFPLIKQFRGYIQGFSGYGQSLIEYDHYSNNIGVGIALNDWI